MKRTATLAVVLILAAAVADAQPTTLGGTSDAPAMLGGIAPDFGASGLEALRPAAVFPTGGSRFATDKDSAPVRMNLAAALYAASFSPSPGPEQMTMLSSAQARKRVRDRGRVDWPSLLTEQVLIDTIMHTKRIYEPKTIREVEAPNQFDGYVAGLKGYFDHGLRWGDGDGFVTNNVGHPIMGAIYSHVYTNHDRACARIAYGDTGYWPCMRRATIYAAIASANFEFNPVISETAVGHVGKAHTCVNGTCTGEGGWTDFVMTPIGGIGIRIAGDFARATLWPTLDRHLSGNAGARVLNVAIKALTDPSGMINAALNLNFKGALAPNPARRGW
jgi:hypothetical protein